MKTSHKLGTLSALVYFVNHRDPNHWEGYIMLAPFTAFPTPEGYSRHEADTLAEIDKVQKRLLEQCKREWEAERLFDERQWAERWKATTDNLYQRLASSETSQYDKDFIRAYLDLREEKRAKHANRFDQRNAYLYAREFDLKDRRSDTEEVRLSDIEARLS